MEQIVMFKWETEDEFAYRTNLGDIGLSVGKSMDKLTKFRGQAENGYKFYSDIKKEFISGYNKVFGLKVPLIYAEIDKYIRDSYDYYLKALDILINIYKDYKNIKDKKNFALFNKTGNFITAGNSFINIVTCKNFELFEKQQVAYYKSQEVKKR